MPRETEQSDGPSSLPAPELNPLLNPLLGQNMGRWAEVYFKSPPEKREQAVMELLRELRAENPEGEGAIPAAPPLGSQRGFPPLDPIPLQAPEFHQPALACRACGRENPASHRFCGMCGKSLLEESVVAVDFPVSDFQATVVPLAARQRSDEQKADIYPVRSQTTGFHVSDLHISEQYVAEQNIADSAVDRGIDRAGNDRLPQQAAALRPLAEPRFSDPRVAVYEPVQNTGELSLFQRGGGSGYSDGQAEEMFLDPPPRRPYRFYVGTVLAIVIFALGFMAWRSMQAASQNARVEPQAPPVVATQPAEATAGANAVKNESPSRTAEADPPVAAPSKADSAAKQTGASPVSSPARYDRVSDDAAKRNNPAGDAPPAALSPPTTAQKTPEDSVVGYGAEELATAQRYLDGTDGQPRDPAEAAQWLWKAMAKHNAKAPLLLADLYLKGEGVSKNCDQARVLLDSATRAGVKDTAERLRHLQAFGCQ